MFMKRFYDNLPVRTCSIHFCIPDIPLFHIYRACFILTMSNSYRNRMKFHHGENVEIRYALKGYGIPVELIPLTDTGNIKTIYLKQWMKLRRSIDAMKMSKKGLNVMLNVIECPRSQDVVFRSGTSMSCHPGNVRFRCLLESITCPDVVLIKTTQAELAEQVILKIQETGGRFLKWNNQGFWTEIRDKLQIHSKVALSIRDFKYKSKTQRNNRQNNESYTYMFCQDSSKRKRNEGKVDAKVDASSSVRMKIRPL